eukprot:scaffold263147_cov18-Prasinocladus_malaysianus.AAC.1
MYKCATQLIIIAQRRGRPFAIGVSYRRRKSPAGGKTCRPRRACAVQRDARAYEQQRQRLIDYQFFNGLHASSQIPGNSQASALLIECLLTTLFMGRHYHREACIINYLSCVWNQCMVRAAEESSRGITPDAASSQRYQTTTSYEYSYELHTRTSIRYTYVTEASTRTSRMSGAQRPPLTGSPRLRDSSSRRKCQLCDKVPYFVRLFNCQESYEYRYRTSISEDSTVPVRTPPHAPRPTGTRTNYDYEIVVVICLDQAEQVTSHDEQLVTPLVTPG